MNGATTKTTTTTTKKKKNQIKLLNLWYSLRLFFSVVVRFASKSQPFHLSLDSRLISTLFWNHMKHFFLFLSTLFASFFFHNNNFFVSFLYTRLFFVVFVVVLLFRWFAQYIVFIAHCSLLTPFTHVFRVKMIRVCEEIAHKHTPAQSNKLTNWKMAQLKDRNVSEQMNEMSIER